MNRFMYLTRRHLSNDIKSFYPKCINCINYKKDNQSCKKFVIQTNYIDYNLNNELAVNVRNDNTKCGESGNLFDIGEKKLIRDNKILLNSFYFTSILSSVTCYVTEASIVTLLPITINFLSIFLFLIDSYNSEKTIDSEKKRIENLKQFHNK